MRTAANNCTTSPQQHFLSQEAASALQSSLLLARRRGHAQLTPLHVAATLLATSSPSSSSFRIACIESQPSPIYYNSSSIRALELCFNVALNRLPSSSSESYLYYRNPSSSPQHTTFLSNALVAALKRAHQSCLKRGCCLSIRVELEQLVLSILDDPSVSRVMKEAGFSSASIKFSLEKEKNSLFSRPMAAKEDDGPEVVMSPLGGGSSAVDSRIPRTVARFRRQKISSPSSFDGERTNGDKKRRADGCDSTGGVGTKRCSRGFDLNVEASVEEFGDDDGTSSSDLTLEERELLRH